MAAVETEARHRIVGMDPALFKATTQGSVGSLRKLVERDVKILSSKTPQDNTVLHLAAVHGHHKFARELLTMSEELIVAKNADGDTALHLAAKMGRQKVAELLIGVAQSWPEELNTEDTLLRNPLMTTNREGNNPLHEAVRHRKTAVALALLDAGYFRAYDLNDKMESPLDMAAREGLVHVVRKVLDFVWVGRASSKAKALHQAVLGGHTEVVEIMLEKQYAHELVMTDSNGNNVLHYAALKNNSLVVELLLVKNMKLAYSRNKDRQTPLHVAALYGSTAVIKALLRHCSDVTEMEDGYGRNALHTSIISGKEDTVRCLLRHVRPAELLNRADNNGDTPLHLAAKMSRVQCGLLLVNDLRVDPCARDRDDLTARSYLEKKWNHGEMNTYEVHLWNQLKKQESKRCRNRLLPPTVPGERRSLSNKDFDSVVDSYFLAATLIATVTFAATFTMPGGYDQTKGTPLLGHNSSFKIFVVSNTVAMCSSIVVIFLLIWARQEPVKLRLHNLMWSQTLTIVACVAMLISLMTAVYTTVAPTAPWPAYIAIAIGISSPALFFIISWMGR